MGPSFLIWLFVGAGVVLIFVVLVVLLVLRPPAADRNEPTLDEWTGLQTDVPPPEDEFRVFTGEVDGEVYHVDSLAEDMVAVWIEIPSHEMALPGTFAINPNVSNEPIDDAARAAEIAALFEMGARDVDVGFHSDDVSVNFPMDAVRVDREFAEQAVRYLMALKRKSLAKSD